MIRRSAQRSQTSVTAEALRKNANAQPKTQPKIQELFASIDSSLATSDGDLALKYYEELLAPTIAKPLTLPRIAELMFVKFLTKSPFVALNRFLATNALGGDIDVAMELARMCGLSNSAAEGDGKIVFENIMKPGAQIILNRKGAPSWCVDSLDGPTPIVIALAAGRLDLVKRILADKEFKPEILSKVFALNYHGIEINSSDWRTLRGRGKGGGRGGGGGHHRVGCDVVHLCAKNDMYEALSLLATQDTLKSQFSTLLCWAAEECKVDILGTLLALPDLKCIVNSDSDNPLHAAIRRMHIKAIEVLLQNGADASAVESGKSALELAFNYSNMNIVTLLLANGADVNGSGDRAPLLWATRCGWLDVMATMIRLGAEVNVPSTSISPLHYAVKKGKIEEVGLLLKSGADLNAYGKVGGEKDVFTPLQLAVECNKLQLVELLLASGADPLKCSNAKECPLFYSMVIEAKTSDEANTIFQKMAKQTIKSADEAFIKALAKEAGVRGSTILELAAAANDVETVIAFAKAGADPLLGLRIACEYRNYESVAALIKVIVNAPAEFSDQEWNTKVAPLLGDIAVK